MARADESEPLVLRDAYRIAREAWFTPGAKDWREIRLQTAAILLHGALLVGSTIAILHHIPRWRMAVSGKYMPRGL